VPVEESSTTTFDQPRCKQGKTFFWCCDMRRAAIILNTLNFGLIVLQMYLYLMVMKSEDSGHELIVAARDMLRLCIVEVILVLVAIWGSVMFNSKAVFAGVILYGIGMISSIRLMNLPGVLINGLFLFPSILLCMEIKRYVNLTSPPVLNPGNVSRRTNIINFKSYSKRHYDFAKL
jgi:hypothetical protein